MAPRMIGRVAHVHGFSSDANSHKGIYLARELKKVGVELVLPDLTMPSFEEITFTAALRVLDEMDRDAPGEGPWRISASSMGAYVVALWAERHPEKVDRLVLLCPAFGLAKQFEALVGSDAMALWEEQGWLDLEGPQGDLRPVQWRFIEDARRYPTHPEVGCPTVIVHGRQDPTIPVESSRKYSATRDHVRLIEVDDDHSLAGSLERITAEVLMHFELPRSLEPG